MEFSIHSFRDNNTNVLTRIGYITNDYVEKAIKFAKDVAKQKQENKLYDDCEQTNPFKVNLDYFGGILGEMAIAIDLGISIDDYVCLEVLENPTYDPDIIYNGMRIGVKSTNDESWRNYGKDFNYVFQLRTENRKGDPLVYKPKFNDIVGLTCINYQKMKIGILGYIEAFCLKYIDDKLDFDQTIEGHPTFLTHEPEKLYLKGKKKILQYRDIKETEYLYTDFNKIKEHCHNENKEIVDVY